MARNRARAGRKAKKFEDPNKGQFHQFVNLPNELIYEIAEKVDRRDLPALCRASKLTCTIATPSLYRDIVIGSWGIARLVSSLLLRPELARNTVSLDVLTVQGESMYRPPPNRLNLHPRIIEMLGDATTGQRHSWTSKDYLDQLFKVLLGSFHGQNLETLNITFEGCFKLWDVEAVYPKLANLHLQSTTQTMSIHQRNDLVEWIEDRAPSLQDLTLTNVVTCCNQLATRLKTVKSLRVSGPRTALAKCRHYFPREMDLGNITVLDLDEAMLGAWKPPNILSCCPRLEDFRLTYYNPDQIDLPMIVSSLRLASNTLRSLRIDPVDTLTTDPNFGRRLASLECFKKLETLRIPASFFIGKEPRSSKALKFLTSLPPSLETLEIYTESKDLDKMLDKFQEREKKFPKLRCIELIPRPPHPFLK